MPRGYCLNNLLLVSAAKNDESGNSLFLGGVVRAEVDLKRVVRRHVGR